MTRLLPLLVVMALVAAIGCGRSARVLGPADYNNGGLAILPQELELSRGKLELKFTFINHTDKVMYVDRDQMMVRLSDGSTRARHKGTWMGMASGTHTIPPGLSHDVFMDFELGDEFAPGPIALVLSGVIVDGKPLPLPDYVMTLQQ